MDCLAKLARKKGCQRQSEQGRQKGAWGRRGQPEGASQNQQKSAPKGVFFSENVIRKGDGREFIPRRKAPL
jgi:hypothetical protein